MDAISRVALLPGTKEIKWVQPIPHRHHPFRRAVTIRVTALSVRVDDYRLPLGECILKCEMQGPWLLVKTSSADKSVVYLELVDIRSKDVRILSECHASDMLDSGVHVSLRTQTVRWQQHNKTLTFREIGEMDATRLPFAPAVPVSIDALISTT